LILQGAVQENWKRSILGCIFSWCEWISPGHQLMVDSVGASCRRVEEGKDELMAGGLAHLSGLD
jgi:hypothetical protein